MRRLVALRGATEMLVHLQFESELRQSLARAAIHVCFDFSFRPASKKVCVLYCQQGDITSTS